MSPGERQLLEAYRAQGPAAAIHTWLRWRSAPLDRLARHRSHPGRCLDIGCGRGLLAHRLAQLRPDADVLGVDPDASRVRSAVRAGERLGLSRRVRFETIGRQWTPPAASFDTVFVVDVLYLLGLDEATKLLRAATASLCEGGVLVVKEMADTPRWKRLLAGAQETLSVRVLGLTHGKAVALLSEADIESVISANGMTTNLHYLDRGYAHPHLAISAERLPERQP